MSDTSSYCCKSLQSSEKSRISMPLTERERVDSTFELGSINRTEPPSVLKPTWRSLFAFATRKQSCGFVFAIFSAILSSIARPAAAVLYGKVFSTLIKYGSAQIGLEAALKEISWWCIGLTALGVYAWLMDGIFVLQWMRFGEGQAKRVREQMFAGLLDKNMEWYDLREDGIDTLLVRIQTQIRELQIGVSQPLGFLFFEIFCTIASLVIAVVSSWKLTFVLLATLPLAWAALWIVSRNLGPAIEEQKRNLTIASKQTNTAITAIDTVKVFNGQDEEIWQYYTAIKKASKSYLIQARANASQSGVLKLFMIGIFVQGFWYGFYLVRDGLDPGNLVTAFFACLTALQAVEVVLPQWLVLKKAMSAGATLKSILSEIEDGGSRERSPGSLWPPSCSGDIEINNISFAYPSNPGQTVLTDATFFFPANETSFVVGRSGSGKSTLGNMLMKYYEPHSGEIFIDGHPIDELATEWVRKNITLVQQQSVLFNETIFQNIAFGKTSEPTEEQVWEAVRTADLENTLSELADGLYTHVGSNGKSLSGGQQQRIAIARARLRDTPILILDEATSALDQRSKERVNNLTREWRKGKTTIIITHDISQIFDDEYVYVMENGNVVQEGYRKKLAEKLHGTFASFLPSKHERHDSISSRFHQCRLSAPASPNSPAPESPDHEYSHGWNHISNIFDYDSPQIGSGTFSGLQNHRLSMGLGASQANALRAEAIWSSPSHSHTKQFQIYSSRAPPKSFQSPRLSLQLPDIISPTQNEVRSIGIASPPATYSTYAAPAASYRARPSPVVESFSNIDSAMDSVVESRSPRATPPKAQIVSDLEVQKPNSTTLKEILSTIWPSLNWQQKIVLVMAFVAALAAAALTPVFAFMFALLLKVYYTTGPNQAKDARFWSLIMLAIAVVDGLTVFTYHYCFEYCGQAWVDALRVEALKKVLAQPKSWFDKKKNSAACINETLDRNAEEMRNLLGRFVGPCFLAFWMIVITVVWAFTISWNLTAVALATTPVMYAATRSFNYASCQWEEKSNNSALKANSIFTDTLANIRLVRALTLENHFDIKHKKATLDTYQIGLKRATYSGLIFGLANSMSIFITALIFYYSTLQFRNGKLSVDQIIQVVQLLMFGISNAMIALYFVPQINVARTTATQMLRLARLPLQSHESFGNHRLATPFPIKMSNLSFDYLSRSGKSTLSNINLTLKPGSCTTIVGPSGSGKSTIASILLGLYPPNSTIDEITTPALLFNDIPVSLCSMTALRSFMSVVPQQPTLFPSTILSNITYGLPEDHPLATLHSAIIAAKEAGIHDFIVSLDSGYRTLIGDGGMGVSGGQAQRIAIARALVRKPKVLVLDEATSALDAVTAEGIRETILKLLKDKKSEMAVLAISHGVEMMKIADEVVMIEGGCVVERGGFEELRRRGGKFSILIGKHSKGLFESKEFGEPGREFGSRPMTPVDSRMRDTKEWRRKSSL